MRMRRAMGDWEPHYRQSVQGRSGLRESGTRWHRRGPGLIGGNASEARLLNSGG
jgi:hypothetical protein